MSFTVFIHPVCLTVKATYIASCAMLCLQDAQTYFGSVVERLVRKRFSLQGTRHERSINVPRAGGCSSTIEKNKAADRTHVSGIRQINAVHLSYTQGELDVYH